MLRNAAYVLFVFFVLVGIHAEVLAAEKDLAAYWAFEEGAGATAKDMSGNGNHGKISGKVEWTEGIIGQAIECKGGTVVDCGMGKSLLIDQDLTTQFWLNPTKKIKAGMARINILYMTWGPMFAFCPAWAPDGVLYFWFDGPKPKPGVRSKIKQWEKNTWYYIVGTYDGSVVKLYVNAELQGSFNAKGDILDRQNPLKIGQNYMGIVDEVKVYSRALTEKEVERDYKWGLAGGKAVDVSGKLPLTWGQIKSAL